MIRPRVGTVALSVTGALTALAILSVVTLRSPWMSAFVESRATTYLEQRLNAKAHVGTLEIVLYPRLSVSGTQFHLTKPDAKDDSPFLSVERFHIEGTPWQLFRRHVSRIELDGFVLTVQRGGTRPPVSRPRDDVRVDALTVRNGRLLVVPSNPDKLPLEFTLHEVTLKDFGFDRSSAYTAQVTNPKPTALIQAEGRIGPWDAADLATTPIAGAYLLANGDLGSIKGLGGHLQSSGRFQGTFARIRVEGTTASANFHLQLAGNDVRLDTHYIALVDGTSGDTTLEQVDARLGSSRLTARGSITSTPGSKRRTIALQVAATDAKLEDLLRLAIGGAVEPPMTGLLNLDTSFLLPPSEEEVPLRLRLSGQFRITGGQFASDLVQDKVDELSRRGRGQPGNQRVNNVLSTFGGSFSMNAGVLTLPRLRFSVNGARVDLTGNYRLPTATMAFRGTLRLDAPVSKTVSGFKSVLLKAVDPLFRRNGAGTQLPIAITGTVRAPSLRVEPGRIFTRD